MNSHIEALLISFPILLVCISCHEAMHALASKWLGDDTAYLEGRATLNPIKHIDPFFTLALPLLLVLTGSPILFGAAKPVNVNFNRIKYDEYGGAIVGMIGPLTNLILAIVAALLLRVFHPESDLIVKILGYTVLINVGFFVFNSIPWPPLDGSRLLYAFAPRALRQVMEAIERLGLLGFFLFIIIFYQVIGPIITTVVNWLVNGLSPGLLS